MLKDARRLIILLSLLFSVTPNLFGAGGTSSSEEESIAARSRELLGAYSSGELMTALARNVREGGDWPSYLINLNVVLQNNPAPVGEGREISFMEYLALNINRVLGDRRQQADDKALFLILASHLASIDDSDITIEVLRLATETGCVPLQENISKLIDDLNNFDVLSNDAEETNPGEDFRSAVIEGWDATRSPSPQGR